jgi:hypothetical protein
MGTTEKLASSGPTIGIPLERSGSPSRATTAPGERRRASNDRRVQYDRREMIRFEEDRRCGADRRAGRSDAWALKLGSS